MSPHCATMCWVTVIISIEFPALPNHLWGETTGDRLFSQNSVMRSLCVCFVVSLNNLLDNSRVAHGWWRHDANVVSLYWLLVIFIRPFEKTGRIMPWQCPSVLPSIFLDIEVNVERDQFKTKTYDKRENYKFEIVNYPDLSGNIPHGAAYGVYTSQVIRYARVCNVADDFKERVKVLTNKLIIKGFTINRLKNTMKKCLGKHSWFAKKYKGLAMQNLYWCRKYQ